MCFYSSAETTASELYQSEKLIEFGIDGIESFSTQMLPIIEILKGENLSDFNMRSHKPANEKEKKRDEKFIKDTSERVTLAKEMGNKLRSLPKERYTISNYTQ